MMLLPCPFCGTEATHALVESMLRNMAYSTVTCNNIRCRAKPYVFADTPKTAARWWNKRATPKAADKRKAKAKRVSRSKVLAPSRAKAVKGKKKVRDSKHKRH